MGIVWLILKVLMGILITLLVLLLLMVIILLFFPIVYDVQYEKYTSQQVNVLAKVFFILGIRYIYAEDNSFISIKLCGRCIKEIHLTPQEEKEAVQTIKKDAKRVSNTVTKEVAKDVQVLNDTSGKNTKSKDRQQVTSRSGKTRQRDKEQKSIAERDSKLQFKDLMELTMKLWQSPERNDFFKAVWKLLCEIIKRIRPKVFWFDLIIGKENPADTGELIAKLSMAFPFYARYGVIQGDYTEAGFWGEVVAKGKFNFYQLLKPMVLFGLNKEVRAYIKIILNVRKVEKYGV